MGERQLFEPIRVGPLELGHRVVMAPLTRRRADAKGVPSEYAPEYYAQRAQYPGTLIVAEATVVSPEVAPPVHMPLINTDAHIAQWKKIVDAVHSKKSFIFLQLFAPGYSPNAPAFQAYTDQNADAKKNLWEYPVNDLSHADIENYIKWFADSAYAAVHNAGFDGVEIHGANGYLVSQFIQESTNQRTDEYGGSVEKRSHFPLKLLEAVIDKVGDASRVGFRISPWSRSGGLQPTEVTVADHSFLLASFQRNYPTLAYVSIVEPRLANGHADDAAVPFIDGLELNEWNLFVRLIWKGVIMRAGGLIDDADTIANKDPKVLVAFGRYYISNPDLVARLEHHKQLTKYHRPTFYTPGPEGYIDYPNAE